MALSDSATAGKTTSLYFGSAVTGRIDASTGKLAFGPVFRALLGRHDVYSRRLLEVAASRLLASR